MIKMRPFSDPERRLFISVDGPSGAGKSTLVRHLAQLLVAEGEDVHLTAEPSAGPIGALARALTETVTDRQRHGLLGDRAAGSADDPVNRRRTGGPVNAAVFGA
jgi:thymidylate kinase